MSEYLDLDEGSGLCPILSTTVLYFYCWDLIVSEVAQPCPTLCDPMDCSLPGSSTHGIFQARMLEWVGISFSRGIFPTQGLNPCLLHYRQTLYHLSHQGSPTQILYLLLISLHSGSTSSRLWLIKCPRKMYKKEVAGWITVFKEAVDILCKFWYRKLYAALYLWVISGFTSVIIKWEKQDWAKGEAGL